jgi:hypothetical protein
MSYIGPVLDPSGEVQDNPDCLILDKRKEKWRILKCEFKYKPVGRQDFAHNGQFDIAIVWTILPPSTKTSLENDLIEQNRCQEVIVLSDDYPVFRSLEQYGALKPADIEDKGVEDVEEVLLVRTRNTGYPTAYAAYIAAGISPKKLNLSEIVDVLANKFAKVQGMHPKGRQNVVTKLEQTKPPLISRLHYGKYRWTIEISARVARIKIDEIIRNNFGRDVPDNDIITRFKRAPQ